MKPVVILQHTEVGAPGWVPSILDELGLPSVVVNLMEGGTTPATAREYAGVITLGGHMSVYDPLPWIAGEIALIREAASLGIPIAGHCLGSQIMAVAFGAKVGRNARPEIGWNHIVVDSTPRAREWLGADSGEPLLAFQWHSDTFELPPGAERMATSEHCQNQIFVVDDRHLAMQCHLEMTPALVDLSVSRNGAQLDREFASGNAAVTSREQTLENLSVRTTGMRAVLLRLYSRWAESIES